MSFNLERLKKLRFCPIVSRSWKQNLHEGNSQIFEVFQVFKCPPGDSTYMIVVEEAVEKREQNLFGG